MIRTINCNILTPEKTLYEGDIAFAVVQAHNGEIGFLFNHAPLISELGIGEIRLQDGSNTDYFFIEGGVVEIRNNKIIVLAENAIAKEDLDQDEIEKKMKELQEQELKPFSKEKIMLQLEESKLKAKLKVALR